MTEPTRTARGYLAVTVTAAGGTFLSMLDSTVTNLAVPALHQDFTSASVVGLSWVVSGYAVFFAALLAPAGRLADVLGRRRLFVLGIGLFTLASVLCAVAPSLPVLVIARMIEGAGAAAMIPASLAILLLDGPAEKRASSIGLWSAASALAAAVGPSLGGVLVDLFGWRSVFLINLPFGALLIFSALRLLDRQPRPERGKIPDPAGTILLAAGIGALTLGVTEGGTWGWGDVKTIGALAFGLLVLVGVVVRSRSHPVPALDTTLWGNRTFMAANIVSLFYGMAQYPWLLVGVLYITDTWRYSELQAGLAMSPGAIAASIAALGMGKIAVKYGGPRFATLFGLVAFLACGIWFTFGTTGYPAFVQLWLPGGFLVGIGMGAATYGTSAAAAMSAPPLKFASASGLNTTARQFGGAIGVAILAVMLQRQTGPDGKLSLAAYTSVYAVCTGLVLVALVVAFVWLRFTPPAAAPAPAPVAARVEQPEPAAD